MANNYKTYTPFFDQFPKVQYDINRSLYPTHESVTNIFFRLAILKNILSNTSSYYVYEIEGNDTPEIVAEKVYGDAGANWIVVYANQIVDPQFDWVMNDDVFRKYLINKYGSVENTQTTIHHYEKVVETTVNGITSVARYYIDKVRLTDQPIGVPDDTFETYITPFTIDTTLYTVDSTEITADSVDSTKFSGNDIATLNEQINKTFNTYTVGGQVINETTYAQAVSNYEYETTINDSRRQIKVIKNRYYDQIMREFRDIVGNIPSYVRTVA